MPLLWLLISLSPSLSLPSATQSHTSTRVTALFQLSSWAEIRKGSRLFCSCESLVQSMRNFYTLLPVIMNESAAYSPMKTVSLCSASRQVALAPVPHAQHAQAQDQCLSLCPQIPWYFYVSLEWSCWRLLAWLWRLEGGSSQASLFIIAHIFTSRALCLQRQLMVSLNFPLRS